MKGMNVNTDLKQLTFLAWVFLSACTANTPGQERKPFEPAEPRANWSSCPEQRPEMCPQHYNPVCGYEVEPLNSNPDPEGPSKTYSNACSACANTKVVGYLPGACPEN